jgi:hypothetical protein
MGKKPRNDLTADYVRSILDYDPETGIFRWKPRSDVPPEWNARRAGAVAGGRMVHGYWFIGIHDIRYLSHRLAWLYVTGEWPADQLDHINMNREDNRFANLRQATNSQNTMNRVKQSNNSSGFKGVKFHKRSGLWHAQIAVDGKVHSLRYHKTPEEAAEAYKRAAQKFHGKFSRS